MSTSPVRPLSDRIIIRRIPEADVTKSGLIIPTMAKEKPMTGKVEAVGPGRRTESGVLITPDVKPGDVVLFGKFSGQEIKDHENEKENLLILREDEILGVLLNDKALL